MYVFPDTPKGNKKIFVFIILIFRLIFDNSAMFVIANRLEINTALYYFIELISIEFIACECEWAENTPKANCIILTY